MKKSIFTFFKDEHGLTTVEYAVAGGLIAVAVVAAFQVLGVTVGQVVNNINAILP